MILLGVLFAVAAGYQLTALLACLAHLRRPRPPEPASLPPVSILKPVRGADPDFLPAIRSHAAIDYPRFEVVFGTADPEDSALPSIRSLSGVDSRVVVTTTDAPNAKTGVLERLLDEARYPVVVVNDGDISVPPDYLRRLVAELAMPGVGLVTCLYRASGSSFPARFEALGIATDFAPSALVAPFMGVNEFGLGSTLAFRAADFRRTGGFTAIREYIADDYQVGKRISGLGLRVRLSSMAVSTHLGGATWGEVWRHQVRWARTIRVSRGAYYGLPVTHATLWAVVAVAAGWYWTGAALLALRMAVALTAGLGVVRDPVVARLWWLTPVRDLWGTAVWAAGAVGRRVFWRGDEITLGPDGAIVRR